MDCLQDLPGDFSVLFNRQMSLLVITLCFFAFTDLGCYVCQAEINISFVLIVFELEFC